ncbi:hypothetical protein ACOMHN_051585 [Nucella lapillus]
MGRSGAMGGLHIVVVVLLVVVPHALLQPGPGVPDLQHVYPGCKASPDLPDMSYPRCNGTSPSAFSYFSINSTSLASCFKTNSSIAIPPTYAGYFEFNSQRLYEKNTNCLPGNKVYSCQLNISGPNETYFQVSTSFGGMRGFDRLIVRANSMVTIYRADQARSEEKMLINSSRLIFDMTLYQSAAAGSDMSPTVTFNLRAVPVCERQLQVECLSPHQGLIDTPGWKQGHNYPDNLDSCVTLHVPHNHVTMVSLVSLDLQTSRPCNDSLRLYTTGNCSGSPWRTVCRVWDLVPTVIAETRQLSFRFYSNEDRSKTGFRVLYSVHDHSQQPTQLPNGKWNCSVPFYPSFQQHFACSAENQCSEEKYREPCPVSAVCGPQQLVAGDGCFRLFQPQQSTSWLAASETCGTYGGRLALLNTPQELNNTVRSLQKAGASPRIFVGLKMAALAATAHM